MPELTITDVRNDLAETIRRVEYGHERLSLTRSGKAVAAIVSTEDLALLELLEDRADIETMQKTLAESTERIPYEEVRAKLGLK